MTLNIIRTVIFLHIHQNNSYQHQPFERQPLLLGPDQEYLKPQMRIMIRMQATATTNPKRTQGTTRPIQMLRMYQKILLSPKLLPSQKLLLPQMHLLFQMLLLPQKLLPTQKYQMPFPPLKVQEQRITQKLQKSCQNHKSQSCQMEDQTIQTILRRGLLPNQRHQRH